MSFSSPAHAWHHSHPKLARAELEHRRLCEALSAHIRAMPGAIDLGPDVFVDHLAASAGFRKFDLEIRSVRFRGRRLTVIAVPRRVWRRHAERRLLLDLKADARVDRTRCLLVPQNTILCPVRLGTARSIARSRSVRCTESERLMVLSHITENGFSTIEECVEQLAHPDPVGVLLGMVADGLISVDRRAPFGPLTRVERL